MTDVTGVAIPPDFSSRYQEVSLLTGGFPRQCSHWLGMTVLLCVQFFFSETAPVVLAEAVGIRTPSNFKVIANPNSQSLRASSQTGVAISRIEVQLLADDFRKTAGKTACMTTGHLKFDGDSHTSVRTGSE